MQTVGRVLMKLSQLLNDLWPTWLALSGSSFIIRSRAPSFHHLYNTQFITKQAMELMNEQREGSQSHIPIVWSMRRARTVLMNHVFNPLSTYLENPWSALPRIPAIWGRQRLTFRTSTALWRSGKLYPRHISSRRQKISELWSQDMVSGPQGYLVSRFAHIHWPFV